MLLKLITYYHEKDIPDLPGSNVFYSKEMFQIYEATPKYSPILIVAYNDMIPIAKMLCGIKKSGRMFPPSLINKCVIYGSGEYFDDQLDSEVIFEEMLSYITTICLQNSFVIEFRNIEKALFGYKAFRDNNYFPVNWLRVRTSLHNTTNLIDKLSDSRKRQIKKGYENGAVVYATLKADEVHAFSKMLKKNYSYKIRKHFPCIEFFDYFDEKLVHKGMGQIFIVKYKDKIIGGSVVLFSNTSAYILFSGGMNKTYKNLYPGILATWKALEFAYEEGYRHLEFMDVGLPFKKHGYREFALRFGGKQKSSRRWFRFRWNFLNNFLTKIYA